jgi:hypothetical protein
VKQTSNERAAEKIRRPPVVVPRRGLPPRAEFEDFSTWPREQCTVLPIVHYRPQHEGHAIDTVDGNFIWPFLQSVRCIT